MRTLLLAGLTGILLAGPALADQRGDQRQEHRQEQRRDHRQDQRAEARHDNRDWRENRNYFRYDRDRRDVRWNSNRHRVPAYVYPRGYRYQVWGAGYRLPAVYFGNRYWISYPERYRLPIAYPGTRWIRVGPDALLINVVDGMIIQAVRGIYW